MNSTQKMAIVTGASQGIGAGIPKAFVERGFNVVGNSLKLTQCAEVVPKAEVHVLDAGQFALDTKADAIAAQVREFMRTQK